MFAPVVTLYLATSNQIKFGSHEKERYIDHWRCTLRHSKKLESPTFSNYHYSPIEFSISVMNCNDNVINMKFVKFCFLLF